MKTCVTCKQTRSKSEFPSSGFYTTKSGERLRTYKPQCKVCFNAALKSKHDSRWDAHFEAKCSKCGYDKCKAALDVHHLESAEKDFVVSARWSISDAKFAEEAKKCIVLCANCHRELHFNEGTLA